MSTNREPEPPTPRLPARVFISYASEDRERAVWLQAKLSEAGVAHVWFDRKQIEGGERWKKEIDDGLLRSTVLLALLTKKSVDRSRRWIVYERDEARRLLKPIIPLRFEAEAGMPEELKHLQYVNFDGDRDAAFTALLSAIARHTPRYTSRPPLTPEPEPLGDAFVGRDDDIWNLFTMIDTPGERVATARQAIAIQAMGGQGKTMLAQELVRRLAPRYPGGLLIERRGERKGRVPAGMVLRRWMERAHAKSPSGEYHPDEVRAHLSDYGELLVLIDDVRESDFAEVKKLLLALPADATRLLTTRSFNVGNALGCAVYRLGRLKDEDARELVRNRLRSVSHGVEAPAFPPEQEEAIQRLIDLVQGHPLALELAAASCNHPQKLPKVARRLAASMARGLDGLAVELTQAPRAEDSVAVSLNISLEHLREFDQQSGTNWAERFVELGVFPDGGRMNLEMVAAVWGDAEDDGEFTETEGVLSGLFRRAMVTEEPEEELYHLHPLLRALARGLLRKEPARLAAAQLRYRGLLTRAAERAFAQPEERWSSMQLYLPHLLYTASELWEEWTPRLQDIDALAQPEAPAAPVTLAGPDEREAASRAVGFVWAIVGYVLRRPALGDTGERALKLGLACARAAGFEELLDTFVRALGVWHARHDPTKAERYFAEAERRANETGDRAEQGKVLSDYGELQRNRSRLDHAVELLGRALAIHEELGDLRMQAATHKSLGEAYWRRCDFDSTTKHYKEARALYGEMKDRSGEADILNKLGSVEFNRGEYRKAISYFEKALPLHREVENRSMEGEDLNDMGISHNYLGESEIARPLLEQAVEIHSQLGNRRLEAIARSNLASAFYARGRQDREAYESLLAQARKAGEIARDIECRFTEVWAIYWEALAYQEMGRPELALPLLEYAVFLLEEVGGPRERVSTWGNLGYLLGKHLGQRERGVALLRQAIELMRSNHFQRAFGGRSLPELEAMLQEIGG